MGCGDDQSTVTDKITNGAKDIRSISRIVWNTAKVLLILRVAKEDRSDDLIAYSRGRIRKRGSNEGGSLAKSAISDDLQ